MSKSFFRRMAEEKGLMLTSVQVVMDGVTYFFEVRHIIDLIEQAPRDVQRTIKKTFSQIDFLNGDLLRYIHFLADTYVKLVYGVGKEGAKDGGVQSV